MSAMLEVSDLCVSYGAISALGGISLKVDPGALVTLIGGNGAGKTTTLPDDLRSPAVPQRPGDLSRGRISRGRRPTGSLRGDSGTCPRAE